jgi:hypothetical protein
VALDHFLQPCNRPNSAFPLSLLPAHPPASSPLSGYFAWLYSLGLDFDVFSLTSAAASSGPGTLVVNGSRQPETAPAAPGPLLFGQTLRSRPACFWHASSGLPSACSYRPAVFGLQPQAHCFSSVASGPVLLSCQSLFTHPSYHAPLPEEYKQEHPGIPRRLK